MSLYGIYRQLHTPTCVEHVIHCNFVSREEKNLIIAGSTQLSVYRLNTDGETQKSGEKSSKCKLECIGQYSLFGVVQSMCVARLAGSTRDALVLAFSDAKLSLVEFDNSTYQMKTASLHFFEEDHLKDNLLQNVYLPIVRVDPDNRCAVMTAYGRHLVVLPFRRDQNQDDAESKQQNRPPVLASYTIDLQKMDEKISNVLDIEFLFGYYEPTLLILYEPSRTWTGRIAMRQDTCCIVAISLNIVEKVHPIIWSLTNLPYDCHKTLAVPKPIGGVLVFAANSLLYLNQSFPPYGVSVNSIADISTVFPLKVQETLHVGLDCCTACFIANDRLVLSLKGGELYVLTLLTDGRGVTSFNFDKAASSVLTTCMIQCDEGYLFLGSRLGNSLLLKYTSKDNKNSSLPIANPPMKKKKTNNVGDWMATGLDDVDELEVYGSEKHETNLQQVISTYTFEVHDSIMNIGPCGRADIGEPAFLSEEFSNSVDTDLEVVTTSGYGKNGAISVLQRSVRPQVVTTFDAGELAGSYDMWTVVGPKEEEEEDEEEPIPSSSAETDLAADEKKKAQAGLTNTHSYLILSREDSSMILETGHEIMELDHSGFSTQTPTVYAGNLSDNKYILQVTPMGVRLLEGVRQLQHIPVDLGSPVVHCTVADPFIVIMSKEGSVLMLHLKDDPDGDEPARLHLSKPSLTQNARLLTVCMYKDTSGLFTTHSSPETLDTEDKTGASCSEHRDVNLTMEADRSLTVDDEDDLLYGESEPSQPKIPKLTPTAAAQSSSKLPDKEPKHTEPSFWMTAARDNGVLEIYSVPEFHLSFLVKNFPHGHKVLVDSMQEDPSAKSSSSGGDLTGTGMMLVKEMLLVGLGSSKRRVFLMARIEEELYIYEAFPYHQSSDKPHLKLRFKRHAHNLLLQTRRMKGKSTKRDEAEDAQPQTPTIVSQLRVFHDVSGYAGVFICGPYPHWLIMTSRGVLRTHPMSIDGSVTSFASFHNINCQKGFLYFNKLGELRIGVIPTHLNYDAVWPVRKVPLRCTPHYLAYHPESKTYVVCTSVQVFGMEYPRWEDEEILFDPVEKDDRYSFPVVDRFQIQLYSPVNWEPIPGTKIEMDKMEHVTGVAHVLLSYEGTISGMKGYIGLGTTTCVGEELTSRGRIMLLEILEVVPEPGQPLTKNKFKTLAIDDQKGPVTAMTHVCGLLVTAIGQKIYIWQLKDDQLSPVSFIDTQVYIHSMVSIKNMIIIADLLKGVQLLRYQTELRVLSVVCKSNWSTEVYGINYMVDNAQLGFVMTDREKNLCVYSYLPDVRESCGGQWLVRRADMNLGSNVTALWRARCKLSDPSTDRKPAPVVEKRQVTYFATLDGGIGCVLPVSEKTYRRLFMLQNFLDGHIPHFAGLNPKSFRAYKSGLRHLVNPQKNIIDGELVWKYLSLSIPDRIDLAKRIGTSVQQIMDDLVEVDRLVAHF